MSRREELQGVEGARGEGRGKGWVMRKGTGVEWRHGRYSNALRRAGDGHGAGSLTNDSSAACIRFMFPYGGLDDLVTTSLSQPRDLTCVVVATGHPLRAIMTAGRGTLRMAKTRDRCAGRSAWHSNSCWRDSSRLSDAAGVVHDAT